jgi:hypothetical protein
MWWLVTKLSENRAASFFRAELRGDEKVYIDVRVRVALQMTVSQSVLVSNPFLGFMTRFYCVLRSLRI